jgi:hypothetical protein
MLIIPNSRYINKPTVCNSFLSPGECLPLINKKKMTSKKTVDKLNNTVSYINDKFYRFVLSNIDDYDIIKYDKKTEMDDTWCLDIDGKDKEPFRKLSLIIFLTPQKSYKGGNFKTEPESIGLETNQGNLIIFPSFLNYKFAPVTSGQLVILKACAYGPSFK